MLKLAGLFLVLMIVFGILGFVVNVAGALAKFAFFLCLLAFAASLAGKWLRRGASAHSTADATPTTRD